MGAVRMEFCQLHWPSFFYDIRHNIMTYVILIYLSLLEYTGDNLIIPCEIAVKSVIPAIKAAITKQLIEKYNLKQSQAAQLLGISQSAVSKYMSHIRGKMIDIDNLEEAKILINEMVCLLLEKNQKRKDFLKIFCQTCLIVRKAGLMCKFCQKTEPRITAEECEFCLSQECSLNQKGLNTKQLKFER